MRRTISLLAAGSVLAAACGIGSLSDAELVWCSERGRFLTIMRAAGHLDLDQDEFESQAGEFFLAVGDARRNVGEEFNRACKTAYRPSPTGKPLVAALVGVSTSAPISRCMASK